MNKPFDFDSITLEKTSGDYHRIPSKEMADEITAAMSSGNDIPSLNLIAKYIKDSKTLYILPEKPKDEEFYNPIVINCSNIQIKRLSNVYETINDCGFKILKSIRFDHTLRSSLLSQALVISAPYCLEGMEDFNKMFAGYAHITGNEEHLTLYKQSFNNLSINDIEILNPEWLVWIIRLLELWVHDSRQTVYRNEGGRTIFKTIAISATNLVCGVSFNRDNFISFLKMMVDSAQYMDFDGFDEQPLKEMIIRNYYKHYQKDTPSIRGEIVIEDLSNRPATILCGIVLGELTNGDNE